MIQIYSPSNTDYEHNGDHVLKDAVSEISAELNGPWSLTLTHPLDEENRWKKIEENAVLMVPTWMATKLQRYRIKTVRKTDTEVTALAYPVFYDSGDDAYIFDVRGLNKTSSQMLELLFAGAPAKYSYSTNLITRDSETFQDCSLLEALNKFREKWGGEFLYDNNQVIINQSAGGDYGVTVEYGKNITGVEYEIDMTDVVTRLIPYAYNGRMMSGTDPWVDSEHIRSYPKIFIRAVQFENIKLAEDASDDDAEDESITICSTQEELDDALEAACKAIYAEGQDKPKISMNIDMIALEATEEYSEFAVLERIGLGDTVHCKHSKLGIVSDAKVVGIRWDCTMDRISGVTLGAFGYDYFRDTSEMDSITRGLEDVLSNFNADGSLMAERIRGILNGMNVALQAQYNAAERQDVMAILFENLDTESPLYGAMGIGTQGLQIAKTRTADGKAWNWTTAATANGIFAPAVIVGLLADASGWNYWDMQTGAMKIGDTVSVDAQNGHVVITAKNARDEETFYLNSATGELRINAVSFSLKGTDVIEAASSAGAAAAKGAIDDYDPADDLTQQKVFDLLTNNGQAQGIFLQNKKIYLNFSYAQGGTLKLGGPNNSNGKFEVYDADGNEIASIDKDGAKYCTTTGWAGENIKINENIIKGFVGSVLYNYIDMCANYAGTGGATEIWLVLETTSQSKGIKLIAGGSGTIELDAGSRTIQIKSNTSVSGYLYASNYLEAADHVHTNGYVSCNELRIPNPPWNTSSDRALKKNIRNAEKQTDNVKRLKVHSFDWKDGSGHVPAGLVAQELQEVYPELVKTGGDGHLMIDYINMTPYLVKTIQEQEERITALEKTVKELECRLEKLEGR